MNATFPQDPKVECGMLFDSHCCEESAFKFCHKYHEGFGIAPMMVTENHRRYLFSKASNSGLAVQLFYLTDKGEREQIIPVTGESSFEENHERVRIWRTEMKPVYEDSAELFHTLALKCRTNAQGIYEFLRSDNPVVHGWSQDALHIHLLTYLARVVERHLLFSHNPNLQVKATEFLTELQSNDKACWLNKIYDAEYARYAGAWQNLCLFTEDKLLQEIAGSMGASVWSKEKEALMAGVK